MSNRFKLELRGIQELIRSTGPGGAIFARTVRNAEIHQLAVAQEILVRSQYYCPVDTENLRSSPIIRDYGYSGEVRVLAVVYPVWYAPYVHEVITYAHAPPTRAKFLEIAAREVREQGLSYVADIGSMGDISTNFSVMGGE